MWLMRESLLAVARKSLFVGGGLSALCLPLVLSGSPALAAVYSQVTPQLSSTIEHWGTYTGGDAGDRTLRPESLSLPGPVAQIATSNSTEYALLTNGDLYAWGLGTNGQLGDGNDRDSFGSPVQVRFPFGVRIASIPTDVMPYDTGLAVDTQGNVWGWGLDQSGELCLGDNQSYSTPQQLPFFNVTAVAGAGEHTLYDANGTIYACGSGRDGELGDGGQTSSNTPVRVQNLGGQPVTTLTASYSNSGALLSDGSYYDWGYDGAGQIGNGTVNQSADVPVRVSLPGPVAQVALGGSLDSNGQTIVMLTDHSLYAWGNDSAYQLGNGRTGTYPSPIQIQPPNGVTYVALASGGNTSYGISDTGEVWGWGAGGQGQLGNGTTQGSSTPIPVANGAAQISATAGDAAISMSGGG
jgi:alpha-tubulin suppressor-like RCC1 family protein